MLVIRSSLSRPYCLPLPMAASRATGVQLLHGSVSREPARLRAPASPQPWSWRSKVLAGLSITVVASWIVEACKLTQRCTPAATLMAALVVQASLVSRFANAPERRSGSCQAKQLTFELGKGLS